MSILAVPCTNYGTLRKSSGTGVSIVSNAFLNAGGTIQVDSGQLVLEQANFGGGLFKIAAGASVALENSYYYMINPGWSGQLDGAGGGQILLKDFNTVLGGHPPLTLNFPPGMFWFTGGALDGLITNINTIIIWATNNPRIQNAWSGSSGIYNAGLMQQTNGGTLDGYYGGKLINLTNGVYDFAGDGGTLAVPFGNYGTVRKSSGTDVSTISGSFTNIDGTIEVDSGRLSLINGNSYAQGSGALNIVLGGSGAGQSGSFDISGSASLGGQLIVSLTNGYVPVAGDQFLILSCTNLTGTFSGTHLPADFGVNYTNNTVILVVTNPLPLQIESAKWDGNNFGFSFQTTAGQSYTIQQSANLLTGWTFYTNISGDGSIIQCLLPVTNGFQNFFRISQP